MIQVGFRFLAWPSGWVDSSANRQAQEHRMKESRFKRQNDDEANLEDIELEVLMRF